MAHPLCTTCRKPVFTIEGHRFLYGHFPLSDSPASPSLQAPPVNYAHQADGRHCPGCGRLFQAHLNLMLCPLCDRVRLAACLRAEEFSAYRRQDLTRLKKQTNEFEQRARAFLFIAPTLSPSILRRRLSALFNRAVQIERLSDDTILSPIKYRLAQSAGSRRRGRPRRSTIYPELSTVITVAHDDARMPPGEILKALGVAGHYERLKQHLHAGRLARGGTSHRPLQRQFLSLPTADRKKLCMRLLRQLAPHFFGRKQKT